MKRFNMLLAALGAVCMFSGPASAITTPTSGSAVVDGSIGEWNLVDDFFASMYRAGHGDKPIESSLYLRYDASVETLFALVLSENGQNILAEPDNTFIKLGNSTTLINGSEGDDDITPDFAWYDLSTTTGMASGWEASVILAVGSYTNLNVHSNVFSDGESQTSAVLGRAISLVLNDEPGDTDEPGGPNEQGGPTGPMPEPATMMISLLAFGALVRYLHRNPGLRRKVRH